MANNLHISYDLIAPGRNYNDLIWKIKTLGNWAKVHQSLWYVKSALTAQEAVNALTGYVDANDKIFVIDSTNNTASWNKLPVEVTHLIQTNWLG